MAKQNYDETGNMVAYFVFTFLSVFLVPYTLASFSTSKPPSLSGCECQHCIAQRDRIHKREKGSLLSPKLRRRTFVILVGWSIMAFFAYKIWTTENIAKVYNPFEILDISTSATTKDIKSHYKKLSRKFHPDKVKLAVNETMDMVEAKFVEITKAYKSLTDETIRENWEKYGHPDGRQEVTTGLALPPWVANNIWVLAVYGVIFGGALPAIVGRWWFGNREKTKDGVHARSAATFFKTLSEESSMDDVTASLGKAFENEIAKAGKAESELDKLESQIQERLAAKWEELVRLAEFVPGEHDTRRRAFILLYAHFLRVPLQSAALQKEQTALLLQTPALLNSMLNITMSRNWLLPTIAAMRLHAYLTQALLPSKVDLRAAQLPGIQQSDAASLCKSESGDFSDAVSSLSDSSELGNAQKALERLGQTEIVDASFKVIGERFVTPSSFVHLLVKLRVVPLKKDGKAAAVSKESKGAEKRDHEFLLSKKEMEDLPTGEYSSQYAHAPYWPANRKPSWWIVLADVKSNKVVVPPLKISDVPIARGNDYRSYKIQFQAPQNVGLFTWKVVVVSDTFVGDEDSRDVVLKIDDPAVLDAEDANDDDISDPEEDSLAGQMALMRGGSVKKRPDEAEEEEDDESSTDDDEEEKEDDSSSDSDSD
ncbi:transporter [Ganoderma sinense ZZ0214-1]|uniref:Transporter n=1 Tax=Ganoderma sinense ZZ0214-1 TaxID=1077348 RepID=A0A2G8SS99_9APHY|nr:transporter [Ganoderma sinense ZZ0214-1]